MGIFLWIQLINDAWWLVLGLYYAIYWGRSQSTNGASCSQPTLVFSGTTHGLDPGYLWVKLEYQPNGINYFCGYIMGIYWAYTWNDCDYLNMAEVFSIENFPIIIYNSARSLRFLPWLPAQTKHGNTFFFYRFPESCSGYTPLQPLDPWISHGLNNVRPGNDHIFEGIYVHIYTYIYKSPTRSGWIKLITLW